MLLTQLPNQVKVISKLFYHIFGDMMTENSIFIIYMQSQTIEYLCIIKCSIYLLLHNKSLKTMTEKLIIMCFVYKWTQQSNFPQKFLKWFESKSSWPGVSLKPLSLTCLEPELVRLKQLKGGTLGTPLHHPQQCVCMCVQVCVFMSVQSPHGCLQMAVSGQTTYKQLKAPTSYVPRGTGKICDLY